jgi:hypothetical protein
MSSTWHESTPTWVLESSAFSAAHATLLPALAGAGYPTIQWNDAWWTTGEYPVLSAVPAVFQGSLGNAAASAPSFRGGPARSVTCRLSIVPFGIRARRSGWFIVSGASYPRTSSH